MFYTTNGSDLSWYRPSIYIAPEKEPKPEPYPNSREASFVVQNARKLKDEILDLSKDLRNLTAGLPKRTESPDFGMSIEPVPMSFEYNTYNTSTLTFKDSPKVDMTQNKSRYDESAYEDALLDVIDSIERESYW